MVKNREGDVCQVGYKIVVWKREIMRYKKKMG
jgi:hypothetical protein